jgi:hypothetical protein
MGKRKLVVIPAVCVCGFLSGFIAGAAHLSTPSRYLLIGAVTGSVVFVSLMATLYREAPRSRPRRAPRQLH